MPASSDERAVEPAPAPEPAVPPAAHKADVRRPDSLASLSSLGSSVSSGSSGSSGGYKRQLSSTSLSSVLTDDDVTTPGSGESEDEDSGLELVLSSTRRSCAGEQRRPEDEDEEQLRDGLTAIGEDEEERAPEVKEEEQLPEVKEEEERVPEVKEEEEEDGLTPIGEDEEAEELIGQTDARKSEDNFASSKQEEHEERKKEIRPYNQEKFEKPSPRVEFFVNFSIKFLTAVGRLKEYLAPPSNSEPGREDYTPLYRVDDFGGFHLRNIFRRWQDCFCNPIDSAPTNTVALMERHFASSASSRYTLTGESRDYICLGTYNYLGFGGAGPCNEHAERAVDRYGISGASVRQEAGTQRLHMRLERLVAEFLGTEDAITFGMGFATNSTNIPSLVGPGCLVISDRMNHASIILGMRLSGATVRVFAHNDMADLERQLVRALTEERRWRKVLVVVEGVYSMEGSLVLLPDVIRLKKKYGAYLYLDEAHSVGAMGANGRGVVEYYGCDPTDVDIMMGTFTKSFGAAGGYIGGSRRLVNHLRAQSHSAAYAAAMPPCVAQQVISSMETIMGRDGTDAGRRKIETLARNSRFLRQRLKQLGFIVYGNDDSPVVPLLTFFVSKAAALYRRLKEHGVATAVIAYPATPLTEARARFCLSASHTREQLEYVVSVIDKIGDELEIKYSREPPRADEVVY